MGVLDGIRVLDFSRTAPGPYCGMVLSDMGADVVRVDRVPLAANDAHPFGDILGRGKRSVALNLKHPSGVQVALRMIDEADVLIEGFRPGVMERLGIGPDVALARNPRLVFARVTGWGQTGPIKDRAGHDINYIAVSGALGMVGRSGEPPVPPVNMLGDFAGGGMWAALGALGALFERERTGLGQVIDAAMVDGSASLLAFFSGTVHAQRWRPRGFNMLDTGAHFYEVYECADGGYFSVGAIEPEFYAQLLDGLGLGESQLPHQMDRSSWSAMKERFARIFKEKTRDEWTAVFEHRDACAFPVLDPSEAPHHRYNRERHTYVSDEQGVLQPAPGPRFSRTPAPRILVAPLSGEHTREVLGEAGFVGDEIEHLIIEGAVASRDEAGSLPAPSTRSASKRPE